MIGILLRRRTDLKMMASVISAACARGDTALVLDDEKRPHDRLDVNELRALWPTAQQIEANAGPPLSGLITLHGELPYVVRSENLDRPRHVEVNHFMDNLQSIPRADGVIVAYHSSFHLDAHARIYPEAFGDAAVVGWVNADQAAWVPESTRRDTAVFFALKMNVPEPWRRSREGHRAYRAWVKMARDRAHANGLKFIIKTRRKHHDPLWLRWYADEYIGDEDIAPYTSLRVLARARWCVHFESGAAWEAALMGCYAYCLRVPQTHLSAVAQSMRTREMFAWPGVSQYGFAGRGTSDARAHEEYIARFLGSNDGKAGERIVALAMGEK